jgi:hypothetical protein
VRKSGLPPVVDKNPEFLILGRCPATSPSPLGNTTQVPAMTSGSWSGRCWTNGYCLQLGAFQMTNSIADFAYTYSKMSDDELSRVLSDEHSLVPEAVEALHAEISRRPQISSVDATCNRYCPIEGHSWMAGLVVLLVYFRNLAPASECPNSESRKLLINSICRSLLRRAGAQCDLWNQRVLHCSICFKVSVYKLHRIVYSVCSADSSRHSNGVSISRTGRQTHRRGVSCDRTSCCMVLVFQGF